MKIISLILWGLAMFVHPVAYAQSTVLEAANKRVLQEYPDLGIKDSSFNKLFCKAVAEKQQTDPGFLGTGDWPLVLARSLAPERLYLRFVVRQAVEDGALVEALIGRAGKVAKQVDWAAPNPLDGHRRTDTVVSDGIVYTDDKILVFVAGLRDYYDKQEGETVAYFAGDYNYSTVIGAAKRVPRFATSVSLKIELTRDH